MGNSNGHHATAADAGMYPEQDKSARKTPVRMATLASPKLRKGADRPSREYVKVDASED